MNRLSGSECTIKGGDGWERCEGRGGNGKGGSRARIQRGGGERGCGLGRAGRGVCLFLLLFVFFSGHSANMSRHVTRRPINGAGGRTQATVQHMLSLLRWPTAALSPLRWCRTVGDAIAIRFGKAISKIGQVRSLTKANMCRRSNT